jgi:hypothetical protein
LSAGGLSRFNFDTVQNFETEIFQGAARKTRIDATMKRPHATKSSDNVARRRLSFAFRVAGRSGSRFGCGQHMPVLKLSGMRRGNSDGGDNETASDDKVLQV